MMRWITFNNQRDWFKIILNSPYFLAWIYILGDMILKMKKFVIQWRKFESKKSYINEDMNLSIF